MAILTTMSLSQLQTMQHILQEFESDGIDSLSVARNKISQAIESERRKLRPLRPGNTKKPKKSNQTKYYCPQCQSADPMQTIPIEEDDGEKFLVLQCKKCRYSRILGDS